MRKIGGKEEENAGKWEENAGKNGKWGKCGEKNALIF